MARAMSCAVAIMSIEGGSILPPDPRRNKAANDWTRCDLIGHYSPLMLVTCF